MSPGRKRPMFVRAGERFTPEARALLLSLPHAERKALLAQFALEEERRSAALPRAGRRGGAEKSRGKRDAHHAAVDAGIGALLARRMGLSPREITERHAARCLCGDPDCERPRARAIGAKRVRRVAASLRAARPTRRPA